MMALLLAVAASLAGVDLTVRDFLTAYASGDAAAAAAYWTGPEREEFAKRAAVNTRAVCMKLDSLEVFVEEVTADTAVARAETRTTMWSAIDPGKPRQVHERRTVHLTRTGEGWRITSAKTDEELALARLRGAESVAALAAMPRTPRMAMMLSEEVPAACNRRQFDRARWLLDAAHAIARETNDPGAQAAALSAESVLLRESDKPAASMSSAAEALELAEASGDADVIGRTLFRYTRSTRVTPRAPERALLRRVLDLADHYTDLGIAAGAATWLAIEANTSLTMREEMKYALLAFKYAEASGSRTALLNANMNVAGCYWHQADWELAAVYYARGAALARELGYPRTETSLLQRLAYCHDHLGNDELAVSLRNDALAVAEGPACWPGGTAAVYSESAERLMRRGALEAAERDAVAALRDALLAGSDAQMAGASMVYADIAYRRGRVEEALRIASNDITATAHLITGRSLHRLGRLAEARQRLGGAISWIEDARERLLATQRQHQQYLDRHAELYLELIGVLVDQGEIDLAYAYTRQLKARVLREVLIAGRTSMVSQETAHVEERELTAQVEDLNAALLQANDPQREAALRGELERVRTGLLDLIARTRGTAEGYRTLKWEAAAEPVELTGALGDAVVLDYAVAEERTTVFVLRRGRPVTARVIPIGRQELTARVRALRSALEQRNLRFGSISESLHRLLLGPVKQNVAGARLLCIVPSGPLWNVPFHALAGADGRYEIEKRAVVYAPSAALLKTAVQRSEAKPTLLAFGNPNIRAETAARYRTLDPRGPLGAIPEVEEEVRRVAALYGRERGRAYIGDAAREAVLKREAPGFDVLHIATHGMVDDRSPMFSALVLSTAPGEEEDGLLEAREIAGLKLGARLAILSACDTGRGKVTDGEGVIGLSWALLAAGCPTAVVSQWKAVSATTATMMVDFHRALVGGAATPEALRKAQLALRRDPRYSHPFYWAPFVVVGAPR